MFSPCVKNIYLSVQPKLHKACRQSHCVNNSNIPLEICDCSGVVIKPSYIDMDLYLSRALAREFLPDVRRLVMLSDLEQLVTMENMLHVLAACKFERQQIFNKMEREAYCIFLDLAHLIKNAGGRHLGVWLAECLPRHTLLAMYRILRRCSLS
ncbi:uncharacterized protein [Anabrus simplex]|uniref:uncharacterized protein isoform X2 n=1 Tax=Anabrus simplex TaxID=316456 RepID=UPI0035A36D40